MHLREYPLCYNCQAVGILEFADMVHHVKPVKEHPELAFSMDNLMSLCNACHNKVEATGGLSGVRKDGTPVDPGHPWNEE